MNRVHFIDSLSREAALSVQILISVGNGPGIDIETSLTGVDGREPGAGCTLNTDSDARLQDTISGDNGALFRVDDGLVEWMGQRSYHAVRRASRKLCVGVERNKRAEHDVLGGRSQSGAASKPAQESLRRGARHRPAVPALLQAYAVRPQPDELLPQQ